MATYIVRRLFHAAIVVVLVSIIVFLMMRLLPGDPLLMLITASELDMSTDEYLEMLREERGLNRPLPVQYIDWAWKALRGDLGESILYSYKVGSEIARRMPITMHIGITSFILGLIIGPIIGILCAIRRGTWLDTLLTFSANIGITAPPFWLGILLIYTFGLNLKWLPIMGYTSPFEDFWMSTKQIIMPVFCLTLGPIAASARQARSAVLEVIQQDYIRTAKAKGLSERMVIIRHVLKNAMMPVVTQQGMMFKRVIGGTVVTETLFFIPGMGMLTMNSLLSKDYPVLQGIILITTVFVVIVNLITDLLYGFLNPRIQYD